MRINLPIDLNGGIKWSTAGHLILIFILFFKNAIFPERMIPYVETLKVDLVALPDTLKKDLRAHHQEAFRDEILKVLKKAEIKSRLKKAVDLPTPNEEKSVRTEKKNKQALARLKSLTKIQDTESSPSAKPIRGNRLSPGLSLSEDAKEAPEVNYLNVLKDRLQDHWTLPAWLDRQSLEAQVRIYVGPQGTLQSLHFVKSSGNTQFDDAVKRAINASLPFPLPPKDIEGILMNNGVLVGFPL